MAIKICLDAGHYGKYNRSPVVLEYYESEMNWKLHNFLKEELESYGIEVIQTRAEQAKDLALTSRGKASKGCNLFLSIHSNASNAESVDRPVVIVQLDGKGNALGEKLAECIKSTMGTKQPGRVITKKGKNGEYYGVLRGAAAVGTVGMILEHSFHTNTRSTNWLLDDANLRRMAEAEAKVIADYFDIKADKLEVDGLWGTTTTTRLQQIFGTSVDGKVSNQWASYMDENPGLTSGWQWYTKPNGKGSQLIKAMQKWAGMSILQRDGEVGPATIKAFQRKLGTTVDGKVSEPSQMVKALQRWANEQ